MEDSKARQKELLNANLTLEEKCYLIGITWVTSRKWVLNILRPNRSPKNKLLTNVIKDETEGPILETRHKVVYLVQSLLTYLVWQCSASIQV